MVARLERPDAANLCPSITPGEDTSIDRSSGSRWRLCEKEDGHGPEAVLKPSGKKLASVNNFCANLTIPVEPEQCSSTWMQPEVSTNLS